MLVEKRAENLHAKLLELDEKMAERLKPADGQRLARALEVILSTGRSLADFQADEKSTPLLAGLSLDRRLILPERNLLLQRIEARSKIMLQSGALKEVERFQSLNLPKSATARMAIGVREISDYHSGKLSHPQLLERLIIATRRYAKRQSTWFRNQFGENWKRIE